MDKSASDQTSHGPEITAGERAFERCKSCGAYDWVKSHRCPPTWQVRRKDDEWDDWEPAFGLSAEDAAINWCEKHDCENEYIILQSGEEVLFVRKEGDDGDGVRVEILAESRPHYSAYAEDEAPAVPVDISKEGERG